MPTTVAQLAIRENVPLADHTTLQLGGNARLFVLCTSLETLRSALAYARRRKLRLHILGGGSNTVFSDRGFNGLVVKVGIRGTSFQDTGNRTHVTCGAGEEWDDLVRSCVERGLAGIECLSGIPGSVGATPIQNVGAYGQEVSETLVSVRALDVRSLELVEFGGGECGFRYRESRFKMRDAGRYAIVEVTLSLAPGGVPDVRYAELKRYLESRAFPEGTPEALRSIRSAVLHLRRKKAMVIDPRDPDSRSAGSFFVNPVLKREEFLKIERRWRRTGSDEPIVHFPATGDLLKIPAAWLVEHAGFRKGYRKGGVGISSHHALALVNYGGTTRELLALARDIERAVRETFGVRLVREPVLVKY